MIQIKKIPPFKHKIDRSFSRADIEFFSINHFRPSFTVRIYLNDDKVNGRTCSTDRPSYAGSFSIFGHALCAGDEGHCHVPTDMRRFDDRPSHPLTRAFKRVHVTDALRAAISDRETLRITLVAACDDASDFDGKNLLSFGGLQLVTFE